MELGAFDLLEQHRRHDWVAVLGLEGKRRHQVGFGGKQMNWGAHGMRANTSHFEMSFGEASCA
jgi:hypothetical protein